MCFTGLLEHVPSKVTIAEFFWNLLPNGKSHLDGKNLSCVCESKITTAAKTWKLHRRGAERWEERKGIYRYSTFQGTFFILSLQGDFYSLRRSPSTDEGLLRVNITRGSHRGWLCSVEWASSQANIWPSLPLLCWLSHLTAPHQGQMGWKGWAWLFPSSTKQNVCLSPFPLSFGLGALASGSEIRQLK